MAANGFCQLLLENFLYTIFGKVDGCEPLHCLAEISNCHQTLDCCIIKLLAKFCFWFTPPFRLASCMIDNVLVNSTIQVFGESNPLKLNLFFFWLKRLSLCEFYFFCMYNQVSNKLIAPFSLIILHHRWIVQKPTEPFKSLNIFDGLSPFWYLESTKLCKSILFIV